MGWGGVGWGEYLGIWDWEWCGVAWCSVVLELFVTWGIRSITLKTPPFGSASVVVGIELVRKKFLNTARSPPLSNLTVTAKVRRYEGGERRMHQS